MFVIYLPLVGFLNILLLNVLCVGNSILFVPFFIVFIILVSGIGRDVFLGEE